MNCPCLSTKSYADCCEPYISGKRLAPTPEALMRARYSAYVKVEMPFLKDTLAPESRTSYSEKDAREWAQNSEWLGLKITEAKGDTVEFVVKYKPDKDKADAKVLEHHEISKFKKTGDRWFFVDGQSTVNEEGQEPGQYEKVLTPIVREAPKIGRNDPCACGSGKKSKKCCAA